MMQHDQDASAMTNQEETVLAWMLALLSVVGFICFVFWHRRRMVPDPDRRARARRRGRRVPGLARDMSFLLWFMFLLTSVIALRFGWAGFGVSWIGGTLFVLVTLLYGVASIIGAARQKRFLERLMRHNYLVCPDCHYSLIGHMEGGNCPECGYGFTAESLVEDWADVTRIMGYRTSRDPT
jgi:fatty acid desaturase